MERIPAYNWAGSLTSMTSRAMVLALCHRSKGTFTSIRQNPAKEASYIEIYHEQTLTLPPLIPEKGAIFCARSGIAPYPEDLMVLNPFFVQITGLNGIVNRNPWIVTFLVPEQITAAFLWLTRQKWEKRSTMGGINHT